MFCLSVCVPGGRKKRETDSLALCKASEKRRQGDFNLICHESQNITSTWQKTDTAHRLWPNTWTPTACWRPSRLFRFFFSFGSTFYCQDSLNLTAYWSIETSKITIIKFIVYILYTRYVFLVLLAELSWADPNHPGIFYWILFKIKPIKFLSFGHWTLLCFVHLSLLMLQRCSPLRQPTVQHFTTYGVKIGVWMWKIIWTHQGVTPSLDTVIGKNVENLNKDQRRKHSGSSFSFLAGADCRFHRLKRQMLLPVGHISCDDSPNLNVSVIFFEPSVFGSCSSWKIRCVRSYSCLFIVCTVF